MSWCTECCSADSSELIRSGQARPAGTGQLSLRVGWLPMLALSIEQTEQQKKGAAGHATYAKLVAKHVLEMQDVRLVAVDKRETGNARTPMF